MSSLIASRFRLTLMRLWVVILFTAGASTVAETLRFYCGTYTTRLGHVDGQAEGIGVFGLDTTTGEIAPVGVSPPIANSSHLSLGRDGRFLYAISEITRFRGDRNGSLTVFRVADGNDSLSVAQVVGSSGPGPAYVHLDQTGRFLLLANYVAGNVAVYPIGDDGLLGAPSADERHTGSGPNPDRQEAPHPHAIVPAPDGRYVFVPDLGIDKIVAYRFDVSDGSLKPQPELDVTTPPGSGPRHFVFSPDGRLAFCSLELASELAVYRYADGRLTEIDRLSTLPEAFDDESTNAEVRVSRDGKNVYVSNRGHDSIAVFAVEPEGGVALVQIVPSGGATPRNFGLSPGGEWLVVGNQDGHSLVSFRRDPVTGRLSRAGEATPCASPALILFAGD